MAESSQPPVKKFGGNYENDFRPVMNALHTRLAGTNIKHTAIAAHPINLEGVYIMGLMSNCPDKGVNWINGWNMNAICTQHEIDRPGPDNANHREILDSFETILFDNNDKMHVMAVLNQALKIVLEHFDEDLPEVGELDRLDPFCLFRFLQKMNTNYLNWVKKNSTKLAGSIINEAQNGWKGGNAAEFTRHTRNIRKMMVDLPPSIRMSLSERLIIDMIITSLSQHEPQGHSHNYSLQAQRTTGFGHHAVY